MHNKNLFLTQYLSIQIMLTPKRNVMKNKLPP